MAFEFKLPDIGEGVAEGEIVSWLVDAGRRVAEDQPMVEVMTDKATVGSRRRGAAGSWSRSARWATSRRCTRRSRARARRGRAAPGGGVAGAARRWPARPRRPRTIAPSPVGVSAGAGPAPGGAPGEGAGAAGQKPLATPAMRTLARELGVDLARWAAPVPAGRVTKDDLTAARSRPNGHARPRAPVPERAAPAPPDAAPPRAGSGGRGARGGAHPAPRHPQADRREHGALEAHRRALHLRRGGGRTALSLKERDRRGRPRRGREAHVPAVLGQGRGRRAPQAPDLNASFDEARRDRGHRSYDIGIAAATEGGPHGPGGARRRPPLAPGPRARDRAARRGHQGRARRARKTWAAHVHHHVPRPARRPLRHAGPEPPRGRDPGHPPDEAEAGGAGRPDRRRAT